MKRRLTKRPQFENDVLDCASFIALDNPTAAFAFMKAVDATIDDLSILPLLGRPAELNHPRLVGFRVRTVRRYRNYLILYRVSDEQVEIVTVVHGARNLDELLADE